MATRKEQVILEAIIDLKHPRGSTLPEIVKFLRQEKLQPSPANRREIQTAIVKLFSLGRVTCRRWRYQVKERSLNLKNSSVKAKEHSSSNRARRNELKYVSRSRRKSTTKRDHSRRRRSRRRLDTRKLSRRRLSSDRNATHVFSTVRRSKRNKSRKRFSSRRRYRRRASRKPVSKGRKSKRRYSRRRQNEKQRSAQGNPEPTPPDVVTPILPTTSNEPCK